MGDWARREAFILLRDRRPMPPALALIASVCRDALARHALNAPHDGLSDMCLHTSLSLPVSVALCGMCVFVCVCVCACVWLCVFVCERESEREKEREKGELVCMYVFFFLRRLHTHTYTHTHTHTYTHTHTHTPHTHTYTNCECVFVRRAASRVC